MANERSELILRVDDLTHKVLRCESEVAVGETFDLVFFGGRLWDGDSAKVFLYDDKERLLWSASGVVEARSDGAFVIVGCVIDTEQAAAYANRGDKRGRRVYGELIRVDVEGERTDYGDFSFLLHKGVSAEGTPLVKFLDDLSAHNVDGEAHEDIRQEIAQVETSILASVSQDLEEHAVVEETARNEAIHRAIIDLRSEMEGGADGIGAGAVAEATRQAVLAGEIAVGVADSARAAAVSAETAAQAAKDGASYLNLIINASKSALASKDQAQAFATSSSEAKDAAEASIASVNSDRLAVEAARDKVIEARNDVISAQVAVGGLLSSARESEASARESASTASRAASDAESAKSYAESERDRAVVARDEAESFASGAARSEEASEASAVRSEKAAEQSAQAAAADVTALLQGKVDAAEAAKAGAEAAKTAAETAQGKAEAAQKAAASSATAAANSADAAAKSATDLADAVSTAESLDGRIDALEGGTGVYQYSNGEVEIYQVPTRGAKHLKALKRLDCGLESVIPIDVKFTGIDIAQRIVNLCAYGEYTVLHYEPRLYNDVSRLLIFDKSFNQVLRLAGFNGQFSQSGHGYIHNGRYVRMIEAYRSNGTASVRVYELGTNALLKEVTIPRLPTENSAHYNTSILFNPKTGHTVLVYIRYDNGKNTSSPHWNPFATDELYQEMGYRAYLWGRVIVLDENLAPVLDEAGEEVVYDLTPQELDALQIRKTLSTNLVRGNLYAWSTGSEVGAFPVGLLTLDENDRLVPVYESFPVVDESGYIVFATEEVTGSDGTTTTKYVIDNDNTSGRTCLSPVTTFGDTPRQIVFNCYVDDADRPKMTAAKAWRTMPMWFYDTGWGYNVTLMIDGVDRYLVMRDGRLVKSWLGSGTYNGKPPVKYEKPWNYDRSSGFTLKGEKIIPVTGGGGAFYMLSLESFADGAFNVKLKTDGELRYGVTHPYECSSLRVLRLLAANLPTLYNYVCAAPLGVSAAIFAYLDGGAGLLLADVGNLSGTYA